MQSNGVYFMPWKKNPQANMCVEEENKTLQKDFRITTKDSCNPSK